MRAVYLPVVVPMIVTWASAVTAHAEWLDLDGSTAVASTLENATYLAANAFDDNTATRWSSAHSDNHWIYIDLKRDYNITALEIDWETAHSKDYTLRVRTSAQGVDSDPTKWTEIASISGRDGIIGGGGEADDHFNFRSGAFTAVSGSYTSASVSTDAFGRYVMMYGTTRGTVYGHSIYEMRIIPEPTAFGLLMTCGIAGLVLSARRRRRRGRWEF